MMSRKKDVSNLLPHITEAILTSLFSCSDTAICHKKYLSKTTSKIKIKIMKFLVLPNSSHSYLLPNACPMSVFQTVMSSHQTKESSKKNVLE